MILLTKLNGIKFSINAWHIEQVEETPDTVITLTNGKKVIVRETMLDVTDLSQKFFRSIMVDRGIGGSHVPK